MESIIPKDLKIKSILWYKAGVFLRRPNGLWTPAVVIVFYKDLFFGCKKKQNKNKKKKKQKQHQRNKNDQMYKFSGPC